MQVLRQLGLVSLSAAVVLAAGSASAVSFGFGNITNNGNTDVGGQLSVDVTDSGSNTVTFQFFNAVGTASSITDIYFDDGTLFGISSITVSAGVAFDDPATPSELPGANNANPDFVTSAGFSADSDAPVSSNGVNAAGEWVKITFGLINGKTFADTIAALQAGNNLCASCDPDSPVDTLRIGLHVQAIGATNGSDSYVTVPEPTGVLLFGIGALIAGAAIRKRS